MIIIFFNNRHHEHETKQTNKLRKIKTKNLHGKNSIIEVIKPTPIEKLEKSHTF